MAMGGGAEAVAEGGGAAVKLALWREEHPPSNVAMRIAGRTHSDV